MRIQIPIQARQSDKRIRADIYSGGLMNASGQWVIVDLAGLQIDASTPILLEHDDLVVLGAGQVTSSGQALVLAGSVDRSKLPPGQYQASIGVTAVEYQKLPAGTHVNVNGQSFKPTVDFILVRKGQLNEVSIVSQPADQSTNVSIAASAAAKIKQFFSGTAPSPTDEEVRLIGELATKPPACGWADPEAVELIASRALNGEIPFAVFASGITEQVEASYRADKSNRLHNDLAAQNGSAGKAWKPEPAAANERDVLTACLMVKANQHDVAKHYYGENILSRANDLRGMRSLDIMARAFELEGNDKAAKEIKASVGGFSTQSLPEIFVDSMHKSVAMRFAEAPSTWRSFYDVRTHTDFFDRREFRPYSNDDSDPMPAIGKDGEIKHGTLGEHTYRFAVKDTFAKMYSVTRNDLINDSAGFLQSIPRTIAIDAARKTNDIAYRLLIDNSATFFSLGNNNLLQGANSALTVDSFSDAITLMRKQVDEAGYAIDMSPNILLVPPALEDTAKAILSSRELRRVSGTPNVYPVGNPHEERVTLVVEPRLSNSKFTNASETAWYIFAEPAQLVGVMAFLGNEFPGVEVTTNPNAMFNQLLGFAARAVLDCTASLQEHRAGVKSVGT